MEDIIKVLMEEHTDLFYSLRDYTDSSHPLSNKINSIISSLSDEVIDEYCTDRDWYLHRQDSDLFNIKMRTFARLVNKAIDERRIKYLLKNDDIPLPYKGINRDFYDEDFLIDIDRFDIHNMRFINGKYSYSVLPSRPEKNSLYFALRELTNIKDQAKVKLRLDPFMKKLNEDYQSIMYKMRVYGNPFCWEDINSLDGVIKLKWQDENYDYSNREFTEMVWKRVDNEVHFICEELPRKEDLSVRGSRYFHSIYIPESEKIIHADAALRIYSSNEFDKRVVSHVSQIGKIGKRVKIFRADGEIDRENWSLLVSSFFYMNKDIEDYYKNPK